jgi:MFS family permease
MACAFSYASDNTVVEKRTMRTGITHSCIFLGLTLGLGIGGFLSHSGLSYVKCFLIGVTLELIALLYLGIMMKNQPQPGATKGKSLTLILFELFDFKHVKDAANSVFKKREGNTRTRLWLLLLAHSCCLMPMMGKET